MVGESSTHCVHLPGLFVVMSRKKILQSLPASSFVLVDYSQLVVAQQHPFKPFVKQHDSMPEESRCGLDLAKRLEIDSVLGD